MKEDKGDLMQQGIFSYLRGALIRKEKGTCQSNRSSN